MKYVPQYIEETENNPQTSEFSYGMQVILRIVLIGFAIYMILGFVVDFFVPMIPTHWEDKLASPIMSGFSMCPMLEEKYQSARIQSLVDSLAVLMTDNSRKFRISVVENSEKNALALPGGNIVIYTGLLNEIESENELAMIMAHELGHFHNRDHLRGLGRSFLFFMTTTLLLGGDSGGAKILVNSSGILQNNYSRDQEYAADRFALELLVKKYGHAGGATEFFKRLAAKETLPQLVHYLSTHPASEKRITALNAIIAEKKIETGETNPVFWVKAEKTENADNQKKDSDCLPELFD